MRCQLPSYNIVGSHFNHQLTVVNSIKRAAHIINWFKPVASSKLLEETKHEYRRLYLPRGRGKLALLTGCNELAAFTLVAKFLQQSNLKGIGIFMSNITVLY